MYQPKVVRTHYLKSDVTGLVLMGVLKMYAEEDYVAERFYHDRAIFAIGRSPADGPSYDQQRLMPSLDNPFIDPYAVYGKMVVISYDWRGNGALKFPDEAIDATVTFSMGFEEVLHRCSSTLAIPSAIMTSVAPRPRSYGASVPGED